MKLISLKEKNNLLTKLYMGSFLFCILNIFKKFRSKNAGMQKTVVSCTEVIENECVCEIVCACSPCATCL